MAVADFDRGPLIGTLKGHSDAPPVSVALAVNECGFPIDCRVFAGAVGKRQLIEAMLHSLKDKFQLNDVYVIADRCSTASRCQGGANEHTIGLIQPYDIATLSEANRAQMLDRAGYKNCLIEEDGTFVSADENAPLQQGSMRFKVCDLTDGEQRSAFAEANRNALVFMFSPACRESDLAELAVLKNAATKCEELALLESSAGYRALLISQPHKDVGQVWSVESILGCYYKILAMQEHFEAMKDSFDMGEVSSGLYQRMEAHCYLCVLAMMMLKLLQDRLAQRGQRMSLQGISQALAEAKVSAQGISGDEIYFSSSKLASANLLEHVLEDKGQLAVRDDTDLVMMAAGLEPVCGLVSLANLKRMLKIGAYPDSKVLSYEHHELIKLALG